MPVKHGTNRSSRLDDFSIPGYFYWDTFAASISIPKIFHRTTREGRLALIDGEVMSMDVMLNVISLDDEQVEVQVC